MHRLLKTTATLSLCGTLFGCGAFVPVIDVKNTPPDTLKAAYQIKTYEIGSNYPAITGYLGDITAYSCKQLTFDPPASKGNALLQLRIKANELGANSIIDVTFDTRGTDAFGTNCWETVQASGIAVKTQ